MFRSSGQSVLLALHTCHLFSLQTIGGCLLLERMGPEFLAMFSTMGSGMQSRGGGVVIDRFYIALFSILKQTHCARMIMTD